MNTRNPAADSTSALTTSWNHVHMFLCTKSCPCRQPEDLCNKDSHLHAHPTPSLHGLSSATDMLPRNGQTTSPWTVTSLTWRLITGNARARVDALQRLLLSIPAKDTFFAGSARTDRGRRRPPRFGADGVVGGKGGRRCTKRGKGRYNG